MGISAQQARDSVRHRIQDGQPSDSPQPFKMVRLEELSDQIPLAATPTQTIFQLRYADVPTGRYMTVQAVPGSLVAYLDNAWVPTHPSVDADQNGNFTLPVAPVVRLLVTYAWQYLPDASIDHYVDEGRQWLREFQSVGNVPDPLVHALISYASARAWQALASAANIANIKAGDSGAEYAELAKNWKAEATAALAEAQQERKDYYTQGPEALDPTAVDVGTVNIDSYTPMR